MKHTPFILIAMLNLIVIWGGLANGTPFLCDKRFQLNVHGTDLSIPYCSNRSIDNKNDAIERLIIAIHSSTFDAKMYLDNTLEAAGKVPGAQQKSLVVAPQFLSREAMKDHMPDRILYWEAPPFRGSSRGIVNSTPVTISSFEVLDKILEKASDPTTFPNLKTIVILGHSAGGQMVNRYAASNLFESSIADKQGHRVRYIVMAPSSYLYFNNERVIRGTLDKFEIPGAKNTDYNKWGHGLDKLYSYHKRNGINEEMIRNRYPFRSVYYLVGSKDDNDRDSAMGKSEGSMLQGENRLQRAIIYFNYLHYYFGSRITDTQDLIIVSNVGHWGRGLMTSKEGIKYIFDYEY